MAHRRPEGGRRDGAVRSREGGTEHTFSTLKDVNGWLGVTEFQQDVNDYVRQGFYGLTALGTPIPFRSHSGAFGFFDIDHKPLRGSSEYTLTFDTDNLPPVSEFWSYRLMTKMATSSTTSSTATRLTVSCSNAASFTSMMARSRSTSSTTGLPTPVQLQNWLPAPEASFRFAFRFYGPADGVLGWTYDMPGIIRTGER